MQVGTAAKPPARRRARVLYCVVISLFAVLAVGYIIAEYKAGNDPCPWLRVALPTFE
jgi:hypothetical protein